MSARDELLLSLTHRVVEIVPKDMLSSLRSSAATKKEFSLSKLKRPFKKVPDANDVKGMSEGLLKAVRMHGFLDNHKLIAKKDYKTDNDVSIDIQRPLMAVYRKHTPQLRSVAEDWLAMEMFFTVSLDEGRDPFVHYTDPIKATEDSQDALYHTLLNTRARLSRQHRTALYSVAIFGSHARLVRWDHAGVTVTRPFDYTTQAEHLAEFLWLFDHQTAEGRGHDQTALPANADETLTLTLAMKDYFAKVKLSQLPLIPDAQYTLDATYPAYKLHLGDKKSQELIVRRPFYEKTPFTTGSTRAYIAYHVQKKRLIFLKDCWAKYSPHKLMEPEIYSQIYAFKVSFLPVSHFFGRVTSADGSEQRTGTHGWLPKRIPKAQKARSIAVRAHVRIAQDLSFPLDTASDTKTIVGAIRDGLVALDDASTKAGIIHGDINLGNIMLTADGRGVLGDWDRAFLKAGGGHEFYRGGTWYYMSVYSQTTRAKRYSLKDDVESCLWLLIYIAMYFSGVKLGSLEGWKEWKTIQSLFCDSTIFENDAKTPTSSASKRRFVQSLAECGAEEYIFEVRCTPLTKLIKDFAVLVHKSFQGPLPQQDVSGDASVAVTAQSLPSARPVIDLFDNALDFEDWPTDDVSAYADRPAEYAAEEFSCSV